MVESRESSLVVSFIRVLIPFMRALLSCAKHLPKSPSPDTIILWIRISTYEFWRTQILSIVNRKKLLWKYLCCRYLGTFLPPREANLICTGCLRSKMLSLSSFKVHISCIRKWPSQGGNGKLAYRHLGPLGCTGWKRDVSCFYSHVLDTINRGKFSQ